MAQEEDNKNKGIWAYLQVDGDKIIDNSLELLIWARRLSHDTDEDKITAVLIIPMNNNIGELAEQLTVYGVDEILYAQEEGLEDQREDIYAKIMAEMIKTYRPKIVLFPGGLFGRVLSAAVAGMLGFGLTTNCSSFYIKDDKEFIQVKPLGVGNLWAEIITSSPCKLATIKPKSIKLSREESKEKVNCTINKFFIEYNLVSTIQILKSTKQMESFGLLEEADIVIGGGLGLGSREGFGLLEELAALLSAGIGATRAAVDAGFAPQDCQIGQTGKTIYPEIYIACGISGATQHIVGIKETRCIIAINKDKNAPIFRIADYGIIADLYTIIPEMIKLLK